ncbi:uncharacterized protein [Palaemon carinicauda]|uniref:uncharacterized protein n=1 Tax=Palaemon carinicauda TaxID=392227 RepID=UPI0035B69E18
MAPGNYDIPMDLCVKSRRKLRLEEFLRQNLDHAPAGRVIQWVNRDEGVFRILWTHQSSGAFTHNDAVLFRYWALARGKPANLSSVELKQSLRMALNKSPSVERVSGAQDEYRYFRFTEWKNETLSNRPSWNGEYLSPCLSSASMAQPTSQYIYSNSDDDIHQRSLTLTDNYSPIDCSYTSPVPSVESYSSYSNSLESHKDNHFSQTSGDRGSAFHDLLPSNQRSFLEVTSRYHCRQQQCLTYR